MNSRSSCLDDEDHKNVSTTTLQEQLDELEMLKSIFPTEIFVQDENETVKYFTYFIDGKITYESLHWRLSYNVILQIDSSKVEIVCHLPHEYPKIHPSIFIRSDINRCQHAKLGESLQEFISAQEVGEVRIYNIILWVQENFVKFKSHVESHDDNVGLSIDIVSKFTRLWIYSHHIYSKFKRKDILAWADELKLSGFSLPGKPGIICVEGYSEDVDEFWRRIRNLNWKKLMVKEKEEFEIQGNNFENLKKFLNFEEKNFEVRGGKAREYHMDLGLFYQFLEERNCANLFVLFFGVEGKSKDR